RGYVLDPDGKTRVPNTQVWLRNFKDEILIYHARAFTNSQGKFSIKAPMVDIAEGSNVYVGTAVNTTDTEYSQDSHRRQTSYSYRGSSYGYGTPYFYKKKQTQEQTVLSLRDADILMEGKVLDSIGSPVDGAFVSAYSKDSQTIQGNTNSEGEYQLFIAQAGTKAGNTWKVSASYREKGDIIYYRSGETEVSTCGSDDVYAVP
ncbi:MAG: carboxypeptidase regulatory-like domain-containing protein, partial [bacterium]|nr:carboxypeptidase regulatory-like domain-containing protein [bacterium]